MQARNAGFIMPKKNPFWPQESFIGPKKWFYLGIHSIGKFILVHKKIFSARNVVWVTMTAVFAIKSIYLLKENCISLKVYLVQESFILLQKEWAKEGYIMPKKVI